MKGIDVSDNNGQVNWQAVAAAGMEFAIIASSYGKVGRHDRFLENVIGAHDAGLKVGAFHYSYALTPDDAIIEAQNCKSAINDSGVLLELPVFFDMEDADGYKKNHDFDFSRSNITAICSNFINSLSLNCGVYASYSWLQDYIDWPSLGCSVWNAQYNITDDFKGYMWQYTDSLIIEGSTFDGDILYD